MKSINDTNTWTGSRIGSPQDERKIWRFPSTENVFSSINQILYKFSLIEVWKTQLPLPPLAVSVWCGFCGSWWCSFIGNERKRCQKMEWFNDWMSQTCECPAKTLAPINRKCSQLISCQKYYPYFGVSFWVCAPTLWPMWCGSLHVSHNKVAPFYVVMVMRYY